jgi:hypothetical protein
MAPDIGDIRYFVEYLDYAKGAAEMRAAGADPDYDGMWDYCDQDELQTRKKFPSKWRAVEWARRHKKIDVFHMPRIVEETYRDFPEDDQHIAARCWVETGYWEMDGRTEIEEGRHT